MTFVSPDGDVVSIGVDEEGWRLIAASTRGPAHEMSAQKRQDAFAFGISRRIAIAAVCDGAGSATCAAQGAELFVTGVVDALLSSVSRVSQSEVTLDAFRRTVVASVDACRRELGECRRDYDTTLIVLLACAQKVLVAHVGDGLAGISPMGDWASTRLSLPANGEYLNETYFVTEDEWEQHLRCSSFPELQANGAAVLLTDGPMPFVIGPNNRGLEPDFIEPVNRFLRRTDPAEGARALAETLNSASARKISRDDKTLVWIGTSDRA